MSRAVQRPAGLSLAPLKCVQRATGVIVLAFADLHKSERRFSQIDRAQRRFATPAPRLEHRHRPRAYRAYRAVVIQNDYARLVVLPELGGRIALDRPRDRLPALLRQPGDQELGDTIDKISLPGTLSVSHRSARCRVVAHDTTRWFAVVASSSSVVVAAMGLASAHLRVLRGCGQS